MALDFNDERTQAVLERFDASGENALPLLQALQDEFGYVPEESIEDLSEYIGKPTSELYAMTTFFTSLSASPYEQVARKAKVIASNEGWTQLDDYRSIGGYAGLEKALEIGPEATLAELEASDLHGKGGGGFPTGRKWRSAYEACNNPKYIICNGNEGDPANDADRIILETNPHSVIEGLVIGAATIGAAEAILYIRADYELARQRAQAAIDEAEAAGIIGDSAANGALRIRVRVFAGDGIFVCGESTALMNSIAGAIGEPRAHYGHTVEHGLHNQPTVLNNVETLSVIGKILRDGAEEFSQHHNTKSFTLTGRVKTEQIVDVPLGTTFRELVFETGDGLEENHELKAILPGGPCERLIPASLIDTPIDFDILRREGMQMGSGAITVLDERDCIVDALLKGVTFLTDQSCGRCTPCREGLRQMQHILTKITQGNGTEEDLVLLKRLGAMMSDAAICALGRSAANPVVSALDYFENEINAHVASKTCPAGCCTMQDSPSGGSAQ